MLFQRPEEGTLHILFNIMCPDQCDSSTLAPIRAELSLSREPRSDHRALSSPLSLQGYTDEPISKILCNISEGEEQELDRWEAIVTKNEDAEPSEEGKDNLPLNVINNYFSLGVDAHIALEFHEARGEPRQRHSCVISHVTALSERGPLLNPC